MFSTPPTSPARLVRPGHPAAATTTLAAGLIATLLMTAAPSVVAQKTATAEAPTGAASQPAGPTVRPEFAVPIQAAQALMNEGKGKEAMAKVAEAGALPKLTPYETMVLERTRAAAAQRLGDGPGVLRALEAAFATGQVSPADEVSLTEAMVGIAAREKDHAQVLRWSQRYIDLKGPNDLVRVIRIQSQAASGDDAGAIAALQARVALADKAGQPLPEAQLRILLGLQQRTKDAASARTLERLATAYPRPEYWLDLIVLASREPGVGDRAMLELYRLMRATGTLTLPDLISDMADHALRLGQPAEAMSVLEEGYLSGKLGTGAQAAEQAKLREQARKQAAAELADRPAAEAGARRAADGNGLADLGWAMVAGLQAGSAPAQAEPGLALLEAGVAKGGLRRTAEARLHLAIAQHAAGRKDAARQTLQALTGQGGAGEPMAVPIRLWGLFASAPAMLPARP